MILKYNKIRVFAFNRSTGAPVTGDAANITATWSKDNGTPVALTDTNPTEIGGGLYVFDLSVAERTVAVEGFLWPVSATSGVGVVVARAIEAEGSQDINTWVHSDVAGVTTDITSMRWWTGVAWADLFVHAGTDRPNSGGVDGPGHYHSYCALPIPPEMFVEFNGIIYPLGKRPQMAKSTTLFIDPQGTIGGLLDADIYDDLFGALATVSDASPIAGGVLALSDIASATNLAVVDGVVDTIDGKLTSARLAKIDLIGTGAPINGTAPVSTTGTIDEIIIGDDYSTANGNAFSWTVTLPTGATIDGASCFFGGQHSDPSLADDNSWLIEGEVSAGPTASQAVITFNLLRSHTDGLIPGDYNWSAEIRNDTGLESTRVRSKKTRRVALVEKYT